MRIVYNNSETISHRTESRLIRGYWYTLYIILRDMNTLATVNTPLICEKIGVGNDKVI
jgi:hypothetical protein